MKNSICVIALNLVIAACGGTEAFNDQSTAVQTDTTPAASPVSSLNTQRAESVIPPLDELEFGGPNLLFAASNQTGEIYAFTLNETDIGPGFERPTPYNLENLGTLIAAYLNTEPFEITYHDLAVHPASTAAFLSVTVSTNEGPKPSLLRITQDGTIATIDTTKLVVSSTQLADTADEDVVFWRDIPASSLNVTDLEYSDGNLFIAGLSTGEFASTLRQVEYPFTGATSVSSIEMFHAAHNQNETRAPIRAMAMMSLNGQPTLVAAYTCTPLVTIPAASLVDGAHVTGKTIAELGYGNVPVEVLSLSAFNMEAQRPEDFLLVINREMSANLIRLEDLAEASAAPGITTPFHGLGGTLGVASTRHPLGGVIQADDQDTQFLLVLRRNIDTGEMELISQMKGAYFRLSDFVSEYNFPDYTYAEDQAGTKMFHNMIKPMEGYPELITN